MRKHYKVAILTGGFDPVTPAHIEYFKDAKERYDIVLVFVNSDAWLTRKKGKPFMPQQDRVSILRAIKYITQVIPFASQDDADGTAIQSMPKAEELFPDCEYYFCNGGDRVEGNVPEEIYARENGVHLVYGVGGKDKTHASSEYLKKWTS